jgi:O-antigen/teichoic acid export membrane protein
MAKEAAAKPVYVKLTPAELSQFKIVYLIAAGFNVINFPFVTLNGILTAYEKFIPLKLADVLYRVMLVGMTIAALLLGYGLYGLVLVHTLAGLLTMCFKLIVIKRGIPIRVDFRHRDKSLYKELFTFSLWATIASLAQRLIFTISPSILGAVSGSAAVAVFGVVVTIEGYVYTITTAINGLFIPKVARLYNEEDSEKKVSNLMLTVGRYQFALEGLIIVGFAILGKEFIGLWMGDAFTDAYYGILLVIIPGLFYNALQIAQTAVILKNYMNYNAMISAVTGVINVVLSLFFSRMWGAIGACASICVAYIFRAIAFNIFYQKKMNLDMVAVAKKCYIRISIPLLLSVAVGFAAVSFIPLGGWTGFVAKGAVVTLIYGILLLLLGFDNRKEILQKLLSRLRRH